MLALLLSGHIVLLFCWGLTGPQNNHWSRHSGNPLGDWSSGSLSASHQLLAPNPTQCGTCHTFRSCSVVCGNHSPPQQSFEAGTVPAVCKSAGYPLAEHPCLTDILSPSTFPATGSRTPPATGSMLHAYNLTCIPVLFSWSSWRHFSEAFISFTYRGIWVPWVTLTGLCSIPLFPCSLRLPFSFLKAGSERKPFTGYEQTSQWKQMEEHIPRQLSKSEGGRTATGLSC